MTFSIPLNDIMSFSRYFIFFVPCATSLWVSSSVSLLLFNFFCSEFLFCLVFTYIHTYLLFCKAAVTQPLACCPAAATPPIYCVCQLDLTWLEFYSYDLFDQCFSSFNYVFVFYFYWRKLFCQPMALTQ